MAGGAAVAGRGAGGRAELGQSGNTRLNLWRGMRETEVTESESFMQRGGRYTQVRVHPNEVADHTYDHSTTFPRGTLNPGRRTKGPV